MERFGVDEHGCLDAFKQKVGTPACASIQDELKVPPVSQPTLYVPLLDNGSCGGHAVNLGNPERNQCIAKDQKGELSWVFQRNPVEVNSWLLFEKNLCGHRRAQCMMVINKVMIGWQVGSREWSGVEWNRAEQSRTEWK